MDAPEPPRERILFDDGAGCRVGAFRCYPWQKSFADTGPIHAHLLVFPRQPVVIQHAGGEPLIADSNRLMLYNRGQEYRRRALSPRGDECEWFAFPAAMLLETVGKRFGAVRSERPFALTDLAVTPATYLAQRQLTERLRRDPPPDALEAHEAMLSVLELAVGGEEPRRSPSVRQARRHRDLVGAARAALSRELSRPRTLAALAAEVGSSPFHLARLFRRETGLSLHQYRTHLRLRASLEPVLAGADLMRLAGELGFAHHSHFTAAFRRTFGAPPSALRRGRARS